MFLQLNGQGSVLFEFNSNQMRQKQYDCHSADVFSNPILLYENFHLLIQINYNLIQMCQLTIIQHWSIGPEQSAN